MSARLAAGLAARLADTEQRLEQANSALHACSSELARYQKWVDQAQQLCQLGSWEWDIPADQLVWSSELCRIHGLLPGQAPTTVQGYLSLLHSDDRARIQAHIESALANLQAFEFEGRIVRADGSERTLYSRGLVEVDAEQRPLRMLGVCHDLTEQRALEQALAREHAAAAVERDALIEQLQQTLADLANRNRELQDFAFVASHDLQEPLRKIRTFSERLLADETSQLAPRARDYLERSGAAAARMQTLIDELLAYTQIASRGRAFKRLNLNELLSTVLEDLESSIEKSGGQIALGELGELDGDYTQMRQVFQNLLSNALKFRHPERSPSVQVSAEQATTASGKPAWQVQVTDNGIGFEAEFAERIFAPFSRLHGRDEYPGTGIGLAIVRRIVERHHGQIGAFGRPGEGATFTMQFPQAG